MSLQKILVRIISGSHRVSHTDPLFGRLRILKMDDLYSQRMRVFSYQLSRNLLPGGIASLFQQVNHQYNTRGARSNIFVSHSGDRSIKSIAPKTWNTLPSYLKQCPSLASFKEASKKSLIAPYLDFVCTSRDCQSCAVSTWNDSFILLYRGNFLGICDMHIAFLCPLISPLSTLIYVDIWFTN